MEETLWSNMDDTKCLLLENKEPAEPERDAEKGADVGVSSKDPVPRDTEGHVKSEPFVTNSETPHIMYSPLRRNKSRRRKNAHPIKLENDPENGVVVLTQRCPMERAFESLVEQLAGYYPHVNRAVLANQVRVAQRIYQQQNDEQYKQQRQEELNAQQQSSEITAALQQYHAYMQFQQLNQTNQIQQLHAYAAATYQRQQEQYSAVPQQFCPPSRKPKRFQTMSRHAFQEYLSVMQSPQHTPHLSLTPEPIRQISPSPQPVDYFEAPPLPEVTKPKTGRRRSFKNKTKFTELSPMLLSPTNVTAMQTEFSNEQASLQTCSSASLMPSLEPESFTKPHAPLNTSRSGCSLEELENPDAEVNFVVPTKIKRRGGRRKKEEPDELMLEVQRGPTRPKIQRRSGTRRCANQPTSPEISENVPEPLVEVVIIDSDTEPTPISADEIKRQAEMVTPPALQEQLGEPDECVQRATAVIDLIPPYHPSASDSNLETEHQDSH